LQAGETGADDDDARSGLARHAEAATMPIISAKFRE
jgi:hypothetical protein